MKRRTSALSVSAAALLVAAPLLTGCSTEANPGAAAVVGDERISVSEVQAQVADIREAQRALPNGDDVVSATGSLSRETVNFLIYLEVVERAAADHGVEVSRSAVQQLRADAELASGGADALRESALMPPQGMPMTDPQIDAVFRSQLLIEGLSEAVGAGPDPESQQRVVQALTDAAESAGVQVNPRYGEWDAERVVLTDAEVPWLRAGDAGAGEAPATLDG